jgi:hypothetical protein
VLLPFVASRIHVNDLIHLGHCQSASVCKLTLDQVCQALSGSVALHFLILSSWRMLAAALAVVLHWRLWLPFYLLTVRETESHVPACCRKLQHGG